MKNRGLFALFAMAIGYILGLLTAPCKGTETREKLKENIDSFKENPKDTIEDIYKRILEKIDEFSLEDINSSDEKISEEDIVIGKTFDIGENN